MEQMVRTSKVRALIVVAPPRTLAELRNALDSDVKVCVIAEINKDLTEHSVEELKSISWPMLENGLFGRSRQVSCTPWEFDLNL